MPASGCTRQRIGVVETWLNWIDVATGAVVGGTEVDHVVDATHTARDSRSEERAGAPSGPRPSPTTTRSDDPATD